MRPTLGALRRALTGPPARDGVHFHLHHDGRPFVCDRAHCDSPALTLQDVTGVSEGGSR